MRESALFALPATLALLRGRARRAAVGAFVAFTLLVYAPLARDRAPGGANFWAPSGGLAFGFDAVQAAEKGVWAPPPFSSAGASRRMRRSSSVPRRPGPERGILATYLALPLLALARWRAHPPRSRRYLIGLVLGFAAVVALLFGVYVVAQWSGYRYAMFLMPGFLPLVVPHGRRVWAIAGVFAVAALLLLVSVRTVFNDYKASRQKRQIGIADYVERYVPEPPARIVVPSGWLYGWRHDPTEVITSLADGDALRRLERMVPFDYVVLPPGTVLHQDTEARRRYQRVNTDDVDAPLVIFRRLR